MHKVCQNVTIFFQIYWGIVKWNSLSHIHIFATAWAVACQAPLSMQFSSQEYWSGLPFPFPGDLPDPEIEPGLLYCKQTLYHLSHQGSPYWGICHIQIVAHISVHFSSSVSSSLRPHGLCHIRLSCPSPIPQAYWKSCLSSSWCHPTISSSVSPSPPSFNLSQHQGLFLMLMSQFFTSGGQSIGASASTSVLLMKIQDWFHLGWTGWVSLQSKGLSRVFCNTTVQKHQLFGTQLSL